MIDPKCFFQLVSSQNGTRSPSIGCLRSQFADKLRSLVDDNPDLSSDYVLVLVDDVTDDKWAFSSAPLMLVSSFLSSFSIKEL